ncbi:hypothetical protein Droror1_Dr00026405 [Drosera rotundifolia]
MTETSWTTYLILNQCICLLSVVINVNANTDFCSDSGQVVATEALGDEPTSCCLSRVSCWSNKLLGTAVFSLHFLLLIIPLQGICGRLDSVLIIQVAGMMT